MSSSFLGESPTALEISLRYSLAGVDGLSGRDFVAGVVKLVHFALDVDIVAVGFDDSDEADVAAADVGSLVRRT